MDRKEADILSMLSKLKPSNLIHLYGTFPMGEGGDSLGLALELASASLDKLLRPEVERELTLREVSAIVGQILEGLAFLHKHNVMHRQVSAILPNRGSSYLPDLSFFLNSETSSRRTSSCMQARATRTGRRWS